MTGIYPAQPAERDRWIASRRPPRAVLDPRRPYAFFNEEEHSAEGKVVPVATIFLTNRECPWRCLMCDLWKNTLTESVDLGDIPAQIDYALERLDAAEHVKLYNSGSFFDRQAIPPEDYSAIAARVNRFVNIVVESHPALIGEPTLRFRDLLRGQLEVAMGLETVDEGVLETLNKRMTLDQFQRAAERLQSNGIQLRVFVLVKPPFTAEAEALGWAKRSIDFAFGCGAAAVTLIPVRRGNGSLEALDFQPPRLETLEAAFEYGLASLRGRVFADTWDLAPGPRAVRLERMNREQRILP